MLVPAEQVTATIDHCILSVSPSTFYSGLNSVGISLKELGEGGHKMFEILPRD